MFGTKGGCFLDFFIINQYCSQKCVFKASERLRFSLFIINQYCKPNVYALILQKIFLKQSIDCFFSLCNTKTSVQNKLATAFEFIKLLSVIWKHACSKQMGCFCNITNLCLKQAGGC